MHRNYCNIEMLLERHKIYLPLLCNVPLELNAFSEDLVKLISPLAYGLVVAQIDVTKI